MTIPRPKDAMRATLALALLTAFTAALFALFKWTVPEANVDLVTFMLGQLSVLTAGAVGFYMNTSKSSSDKNHLLAERDTPQQLEVTNTTANPVPTESEYPDPAYGGPLPNRPIGPMPPQRGS